jgi:hypothetical protein
MLFLFIKELFMDFTIIPILELPNYMTLHTIVHVTHWNPENVVYSIPEKRIDYIKCRISAPNGSEIKEAAFFINPLLPPVPIMESDVKVGICGSLSFPREQFETVITPGASIEFIEHSSQQSEPTNDTAPVNVTEEDHLSTVDPIMELLADLEKYAKGGFKMFGEFRERLSNIKSININQYANAFEEATEALMKTLQNQNERTFANILIKDIKGVMK